jgi:hypothetical protein
MLLSFMAILCICQSGCFRWTQAVWEVGETWEEVQSVSSIRVSAQGDVCVIYNVSHSRRRLAWNRILRSTNPPVGGVSCDARRAIMVMAEDVQRPAVRKADPDAPITLSEAPPRLTLPSRVRKLTLDEDRVERRTAGWRKIPVVHFKFDRSESGSRTGLAKGEIRKKKMLAEARATGAAFMPENASAGHNYHVEVPDGRGGRMVIPLPVRNGINPWRYPLRILLTPPAVALDITEAAVGSVVVVATAPVWVSFIACVGLGLSDR